MNKTTVKLLNQFKNNSDRTEESFYKIQPYMDNLDILYRDTYIDIDETQYFETIKDKRNKTEFAYAFRILHNYNMPGLLSAYYSLKYTHPKYDIICFLTTIGDYNDLLSKNDINILKKLFDVVIISNIFDKISYEMFHLYGYTQYKKLLSIEHNCIINKNIDFLFTKYEKSTCAKSYTHRNSSIGFLPSLTLIVPMTYYLLKSLYINKNYESIFGDLYFFTPKIANILYYTIYPSWNIEPFDEDLIYFNFPFLNIDRDISNHNCYVDSYFGPTPYHKHTIDKKICSKFQLVKQNYYKWDAIIKKILEKHPEYNIFFEHIRTYRNVLF